MAEEIDDNNFYREDFTTDSDWEVLSAQLGEMFQGWNLSAADWGRILRRNELYWCDWHIQTENIEVLKRKISVSFYCAKLENDNEASAVDATELQPMLSAVHRDLMSSENTFESPMPVECNGNLHDLARLYGLRRFVVVHPTVAENFLASPSELNFFLSAVTVAVAEMCSTVPVFVQMYTPSWKYFSGVFVGQSLRVNFNVMSLETAPSSCRYLTGLLAMFKEKLPVNYVRPAVVSVRHTYYMNSIRCHIPLRIPFHRMAYEEKDIDDPNVVMGTLFIVLPYGYFPDSYTDVYGVYTWPEIAENIFIDSDLHTDFVPSKAPQGHLHQRMHTTAYLSSCLDDYLKLSERTQTSEASVGRKAAVKKKITTSGPMSENEIFQMLIYLFCEDLFPYHKQIFKEKFDPWRIKSAPPDSLVCRISCLLATCNAHLGGRNGMMQLWNRFTKDLRSHFERCKKVPGVAAGFPDTRTCLLHQKLQMINICIERRQIREGHREMAAASCPVIDVASTDDVDDDDGHNDNNNNDDDDDDDDEFYDCSTTIDDEQSVTAASMKGDTAVTIKAEGRQQRLGDERLLHGDDYLYIPLTQDPIPKTEDQLHDDAEIMLKLGPGSGLTTQMMCSSLLSDMEAFKAANPKAAFEDFIRWYSPKDWEPLADVEHGEDDGDGDDGEDDASNRPSHQLSARMCAPNNTWQRVWQQAQAVPARRQKRLFDDTNEAIKVLHFLETRTIEEIYDLTMISVLHAAVLKLKDICETTAIADILSSQFETINAALCRLSRDLDIVGQTAGGGGGGGGGVDPRPIIEDIRTVEHHFYQFKCTEKMCADLGWTGGDVVRKRFSEVLASGGSCRITPSTVGRGGEGEGDVKPSMDGNPVSKEYVIRVDGETTATCKGQAGPQFLRALLTGERLLLCGAFADNTTFL